MSTKGLVGDILLTKALVDHTFLTKGLVDHTLLAMGPGLADNTLLIQGLSKQRPDMATFFLTRALVDHTLLSKALVGHTVSTKGLAGHIWLTNAFKEPQYSCAGAIVLLCLGPHYFFAAATVFQCRGHRISVQGPQYSYAGATA